jgi:nicotinate-nucleotide adenylyltransferase
MASTSDEADSGLKVIALHDCTPSANKRIAVLGGSFDPITDGHLKCACEIVHARKAHEVWIVPCGVRPDKPSLKTPYMHRLIMCHLAVNTTFGSQFPIRVSDIEMPEPMALSTYHLMERLKQEYPDKDFVFVIGADLIDSLKSWDAPGVPDAGMRLWNECSFLVLDRPGYELPESLPANFTQLTAAAGTTIVTEEVSSSEIRRRIAKPQQPQRANTPNKAGNFGESEKFEIEQAMSSDGNFSMVDGLLTPAVLAHIIRYRLYSPAVK